MATNARGDRLSLDGWCGAFSLDDVGAVTNWWPGPDSRAIPDRIVQATPLVIPGPDSRAPPDQVMSMWADFVNDTAAPRALGMRRVLPPRTVPVRHCAASALSTDERARACLHGRHV